MKGLEMYRSTTLIMAASLCILPAARTQVKSDDDAGANNEASAPTIAVTSVDVNDTTLKLSYEIRNDSKQDVWICESVSEGCDCEVYLDEDDQTLMIRKRLDVPSSAHWYVQPFGKYMRLPPGEKQVESLLLAVPVNSVHKYYESGQQLRGVVKATRLSIEIGYYVGNLPEIFLDMLEEAEKSIDHNWVCYMSGLEECWDSTV